MNKRLLAYLRSVGLDAESSEDKALEFYRGLRGLQCSIANALNYQEDDHAARTSCDVVIRALGYDPEKPTVQLESKKAAVETTPKAGDDGASVAGDLEQAAVNRGQQMERQRIVAIRQLAGEDIPLELLNKALDGGWDEARASVEFLRHYRESNGTTVQHDGAPAIHSKNSVTGITADTLACGLLHRNGIDPTKSFYRMQNGSIQAYHGSKDELEKIAEDSYRFRDLSMMDIVRAAAQIDGIEAGLHVSRSEILEKYSQRSGFSTSALANIFTTNMSSQLLNAFEGAEDSTTGGWIRENRDVPNFQSNERARMEKGAQLKKLPRGSEADHAEFTDNVESYKIARYAQQFVVDEQDIIDDRFGAMNQHTPSEMGSAARELRPDLVYSIILGNPDMRDAVALFHADHNNLTASNALAIATLGTARTRLRTIQENGRNLNLVGRFLLLPEALRDTAIELTKSGIVIDGTATALRPAFNAQSQSGLTIVTDPRFDNGVTDPTDPTGATVHAGSGTTWYLTAQANAHTIEVGTLRGTGGLPQMRVFVLSNGKWGIGWDIKLDIGAKALSWQSMQKITA